MNAALHQLVAEARRVALPGRAVPLEVRLPALDLAALSASLPDEPMVFWAPPGGPITLGLGAALLLRGRGEQRFAMLRDGAAELSATAELFCGFAFTPGGGGRFGDALALLPRFTFKSEGDGTLFRASIDAQALEQLEALVAEIAAPSPPVALAEDGDEAARFVAAVAEARAAIRRGELDKVVLHRQTRLPHAGRTPAQTIAALLAAQPDATTYAFRVEGETFLGATPERLIRREGKHVRADVLAGSAPRDTQPSQLLESDKDRGEHELTRAAIAGVLRPLCSRYDELGPRIRTLPHLHHLHTAVEGTLASSRHVLDLVQALHPTPAVGGSPRKEALEFLGAHEHLERGWYAAPIGWFRPDGDGDFAVALRCALVTPAQVTLYAGAGIVRNSDPERELAETSTKRRAIAGALGLEIA